MSEVNNIFIFIYYNFFLSHLTNNLWQLVKNFTPFLTFSLLLLFIFFFCFFFFLSQFFFFPFRIFFPTHLWLNTLYNPKKHIIHLMVMAVPALFSKSINFIVSFMNCTFTFLLRGAPSCPLHASCLTHTTTHTP